MFKLHNSKIYTFFITFLIIANSGTVLGGKLYYVPFLIILFFSSLLLFRVKFYYEGLLLYIILCALIFSNYLFTGNQDYTSYITYFLKLTSVFIIFNAVNIHWVHRYYLHIMGVVSLISLVFYSFGLLYPDFIISHIPLTDVGGEARRVTPFYIYLNWYLNRNSGIYSEPGMFQVFVNLAVYLNFKNNLKHRKFLHVLYFVTILTTLSTSGYIIYGLIVLSQSLKLIKSISAPKLSLSLMIIVFLIVVEEMMIGTVMNKFDPQSHTFASFEQRINGLKIGFDLLSQKPFFGWGIGNNNMYAGYNSNSLASGFIILSAQSGLFFVTFYLLIYFLKLSSISTSLIELFFVYVAFLVLINSQAVLLFPLFIAFLFIRDNNKLQINKKQKLTKGF